MPPQNRVVLRSPAVKAKTQMSETQIVEAAARGEFPKPFKILPKGRAIGWDEAEIDAHIAAQMAARK